MADAEVKEEVVAVAALIKMKPVLIDHDDSFTFILAHLIAEACGVEAVVLNHRESSVEEVKALKPSHLILSPGPGNPTKKEDFLMGAELLETFKDEIPILGVCLGHQGMGSFGGAKVERAPIVMHGRTSELHHTKTGLFKGLPEPLTVMRYHSLCLTDLPPELEATAWSEDETVMAFQHKNLPLFGVQFHPESLASEHGLRLLKNFFLPAKF